MNAAWQWDPSLFEGTAEHYQRGRLPYAQELVQVARDQLRLDGGGRLLDVGTGTGAAILTLAPLFEAAVGIDPDPAMIEVAKSRAERAGIRNVRWLVLRAESLPADLGSFRVVAFAQSFHWLDRQQVAQTAFEMLEPGGALLHINQESPLGDVEDAEPNRRPPYREIADLVRRYLGPVRRAGQGFLPQGTPNNEAQIVEAAGFEAEEALRVPGGQALTRSPEEVASWVLSRSDAAPHLFGGRLPDFQRDLGNLLAVSVPPAGFLEPQPDTVIRIWRKSASAR